jgi:multidrug transporter EmrE-like cation transporter
MLRVFLLGLNLAFTILASAAFRLSAWGATWRTILGWQVVGNVAGLVTVVTLTGLLRHMPLSIAFAVTTGLSVLGVQVVATSSLFHEPISPLQWTGSMFIMIGIFLAQGS